MIRNTERLRRDTRSRVRRCGCLAGCVSRAARPGAWCCQGWAKSLIPAAWTDVDSDGSPATGPETSGLWPRSFLRRVANRAKRTQGDHPGLSETELCRFSSIFGRTFQGGADSGWPHPLAQPVELFFSILGRRLLRRGEFASVDDLVAKISAFITDYNHKAQPFRWTYDGKPLKFAGCVNGLTRGSTSRATSRLRRGRRRTRWHARGRRPC